MKLLEHEIDDAVAQLIIGKLVEYKKQIQTEANKTILERSKQLIAAAEAEIDEAREELSAKLVKTISEKDAKIEELNGYIVEFKKDLASRTQTFLANCKEELRDIVAEQIKLDPQFGKAQRVVSEVRRLVTPVEGEQIDVERIVRNNDKQINKLSEEIEILKGRLSKKTEANKKLQARIRAMQLIEEAPSADKDILIQQLGEANSVEEVEKRYAAISESMKGKSEETEIISKGVSVVEEQKEETRPVLENKETNVTQIARMKNLAGLK